MLRNRRQGGCDEKQRPNVQPRNDRRGNKLSGGHDNRFLLRLLLHRQIGGTGMKSDRANHSRLTAPKQSRSRDEYYRTHRQPESNCYLTAALLSTLFVIGVVVGKFFI